MFDKGEYIIYGTNGVCKVSDCTRSDIPGDNRMYYVLSPVGQERSTIYTPVDNQKVLMRAVISREEAVSLIEGIPSYEELIIPETRDQEQQYKQILRGQDCTMLLRFIKALYRRKECREEDGKKITAVDEKYISMVKNSLLNELAIALDMEKEDVDLLLADKFLQEDIR